MLAGEPLPRCSGSSSRVTVRLLPLHDDGPETNRNVVVVEVVVKALRDIDIDIDERVVAIAAVATSGGYEVELLVMQFNRVGKFMHVSHVILLVLSLGVDGAVLTATTYPLVGIRQSGCNVAQNFFGAEVGFW